MTGSWIFLVANSGDGTISTFGLSDGGLDRIAVSGGVPGCSTFAVDAERDLVYAAVKGAEPGIATLAIDRQSGNLTPRSHLSLTQGGMNYLTLTRSGTGLLGASYGGGYGISCAVTDGLVSEPISYIHHPNLHSVQASADGRFAYFVSLGADLVAQCALDDDLRLVPLDPATAAAPVGSGPRHLVLDTAQESLYVLTEFSGEVLHYRRDPGLGTLTLIDSVTAYDQSLGLGHSVFGADPMANHYIWGADLHFSDDVHLWCTERTEGTLGAVSIRPDSTMSAPTKFTVTEPQPRGFAISPDGNYLVCTGERSSTISAYRITDDNLELIAQAETGNVANWVRFVTN